MHMSYRLTKITTRTGDDGKTQLGDGQRIPKFNTRIEAIGTLDELNSAIGIVIAHKPADPTISVCLKQVQQDLFNLGGELCPPHKVAINSEKILHLEEITKQWNASLPPLQEFILPGGNLKSASCHLARTICRRAERCIVKLHDEEALNLDIIRYINRLSDLLFVAARVLARETTDKEELWDHQRQPK